ncbi:MAG: hypothetical protein DLM53_00615 [Candidatus Eremiobacter antarcticus]|nr:hypothetical protein [Candidatus Eremiobacteraeota bacterium]MBC5809034.1 hypothetical protein [Candidatus Eremiobacteraeota bacterium]PZR64269.1 MAG: hypothetical protein DLM53_00615 [Candidatus Eremiobacter sp. RRmetagenome_bin22]
MIDAPTLVFTAHCQVRYIERFLDAQAVADARRRHKHDALILEALADEFQADLKHFRHVVQVAYFHLLHKAGEFVEGSAFRIKLGPLAVCVDGNVCKTTVDTYYPPRRPHSPDEDPMEEPLPDSLEQDAA